LRVFWQLIAKLSQPETRLIASILMIAALLLAFGLLAEEVIEGKTLPFDQKLMLALREAGNPGVPIGPPWLPEAARDISLSAARSCSGSYCLPWWAICF
jgi:undecaprenyl-diphosphatase